MVGLDIELRDVSTADLPVLFAHRCDPTAIQMAAFTGGDPGDMAEFEARWTGLLCNPDIIMRTILASGQVAGSIATYVHDGAREITYWIGSAHWGQGIATAATQLILGIDVTRPILARAAKDNMGSLRVLEKCGFQIVGEGIDFAKARGAMTEEYLLRLDGPASCVANLEISAAMAE